MIQLEDASKVLLLKEALNMSKIRHINNSSKWINQDQIKKGLEGIDLSI